MLESAGKGSQLRPGINNSVIETCHPIQRQEFGLQGKYKGLEEPVCVCVFIYFFSTSKVHIKIGQWYGGKEMGYVMPDHLG